MRTETFSLLGYENMPLSARLWLPDGEMKALVQVTHGMTEHMGRYEALAAALTARGIALGGFDLRGHGENPGDRSIASFGERGWEVSLEDMDIFSRTLQQRFPGIPRVMLGFSLGSFLLREYLSRGPKGLSGAIIMGTGHQSPAVLGLMMAIVKGQVKKAGHDGCTDLVRQLSFGTYNKKFAPNQTVADWLCSDREQLAAYLNDPLCREDISAGLFHQMLGAMKRTCSRNALQSWDKEMPVLLLSGSDDPVGDGGKGVKKLYEQMEKAGMTNVQCRLIPNARHDLLHEECCGAAARARDMMLEWLEKLINQEGTGEPT